jgi:hypothetical protein
MDDELKGLLRSMVTKMGSLTEKVEEQGRKMDEKMGEQGKKMDVLGEKVENMEKERKEGSYPSFFLFPPPSWLFYLLLFAFPGNELIGLSVEWMFCHDRSSSLFITLHYSPALSTTLHHSPPLHHSTTPPLHHSTTPPLHHSPITHSK